MKTGYKQEGEKRNLTTPLDAADYERLIELAGERDMKLATLARQILVDWIEAQTSTEVKERDALADLAALRAMEWNCLALQTYDFAARMHVDVREALALLRECERQHAVECMGYLNEERYQDGQPEYLPQDTKGQKTKDLYWQKTLEELGRKASRK